MERSLAYMGLTPGLPLSEIAIDRLFIGSVRTNGRIEDPAHCRDIAKIVAGRQVAPMARLPAIVAVPGSDRRSDCRPEAEGP